MEQLTSLLILSGICNRILEVFKQWFGKLIPFSDDQKEAVWMTASMVLGLISVFATQSERAIFAGIPVLQTLDPFFAKIIGGILVGGGSNVIHSLINIINNPSGNPDPATLKVTATPSELTVSSTPTEAIPLSEQSTPAKPLSVMDVLTLSDAEADELGNALVMRNSTTLSTPALIRNTTTNFVVERDEP